MMSSPDGSMDALQQLLAERSRYEGWLTQLEARRGAAPSHVLERVKGDYLTRLDQVTTQLRGRAVELESTVASLRARLEALAGEEEARRDERAETELRASVGELHQDHANHTMHQCDEAIASLMSQRESVGNELVRLQDVLTQVMPPAPAEVPKPVAEVNVREETPTVETEVIVPEAPAPATSALESALERIAVAEAPPQATRAESQTPPSAMQELEFLRSVVSTAPPAETEMVSPPVLAVPRRATPMSSSTITSLRDPLRSVTGDGSISPANMPSFLKDMPTEQVKTLKCQECGTMNFPTEWYCERCGGELAAM